MKKIISLFFVLAIVSTLSCAQEKQPLLGETEWQLKMNAKFKDALKSPLTEEDRKDFRTLDFFKFDSAYVVTASFKKNKRQKSFKMKTSTDRLPKYKIYGEITFKINGEAFKLNVYQNVELVKKDEYKDDLFLPFLDNTNGEESYGGGRYIDIKVPEGDDVVIDFNKAYNPYCAYSGRYSCPIVPRENYIDVEIKAGVKAFDKH